MMQKTKSLLTATAFLAVLALPFLAEAARPPVNPGEILRNPRLLARYLKLTADQAATLKTLRQELQADLKPLQDQLKPLQDQLETQLDAASPEACAVGQTVVAIDGVRDDIRAAYEEFDTKFSAILTPEQLAKYEHLKEAAGIYDEDEG
ncbi:MAG TPA: periplasmic heavy metal sensor [Thermoanaerobaculia bacterium]|nr:periplasmic heavy metal sensor [Thermoanaerobaculia bacterium]